MWHWFYFLLCTLTISSMTQCNTGKQSDQKEESDDGQDERKINRKNEKSDVRSYEHSLTHVRSKWGSNAKLTRTKNAHTLVAKERKRSSDDMFVPSEYMR
ncbi:unnamed protein product [Caenorhabditis auriculariae]|uniref:Secreted protein n=1 Tax=Caenorhabditis auriculariae TaxID=2777116 RepID=A0A8S1GRK7_9PELO|nr:unnamed protein product [Caenorhabditis auriculariae]